MNIESNIFTKLKENVDRLKKSKRPKFIIIGGVPGAGKSLLIEKAKQDFNNEEFSIIEPDLYRKYFKNAKTIEETIVPANKMEAEMLSYSLINKKNIIHISSLRAFEQINNLIKSEVLTRGYEIYLYVMVTNIVESSISTYERYLNDINNINEFPRLNKINYLEQANDGFNLGIEFFEKIEYLNGFYVFKRGENMTLPIKINIKNATILDVVKAEQKKQIFELNINSIVKRINLIKENLKSKYELDEFNKVINEIIYKELEIGGLI